MSMEKFCAHQKIFYCGHRDRYLFTWSVPKIYLIKNLNVNTLHFKMQNGSTYYANLLASKEKFIFSIVSTSKLLRCIVTMFIGSETSLFSNSLNVPSRSIAAIDSFSYHYDLVSITTEDECFRKMKKHPDDKLVLICRMVHSSNSYRVGSLKASTTTTTDSLFSLKALATALEKSSEASLKDKVILQVGEEFETVSKALLCARSPVFARMFENDMKEVKENTVVIEDIKMPVLKELVSFLYTGMLSTNNSDSASKYNFDFICDLYYASNKYDIADLSYLCVDLLVPQVSMENINQALKFAFCHNDLRLKSTVMTVIATNMDTWRFTDDWKNLVDEEPKIASEILNFFNF